MNWMDWVAMALLVIGGLNWGLVGLFDYNIVAKVFGDMTVLTRGIYDLVGLAAVYMIVSAAMKMGSMNQ